MADTTLTTSSSSPPPPVAETGAPARPTFEIVPLRALPFVGVVLIALTLAIVTNRLWALDFFHVVGGGLWTGID
ncbi:MAG: hypothetical protein ABSG39_07765, partial [Acidimicrobiales bacterium]